MLVNYKLNHIVANIRITISCYLHIPINCKFLLKFTHKAQLAYSQPHTNFRKCLTPYPRARGDPFIA